MLMESRKFQPISVGKCYAQTATDRVSLPTLLARTCTFVADYLLLRPNSLAMALKPPFVIANW
jgi:hypothetical protein